MNNKKLWTECFPAETSDRDEGELNVREKQ